MNRPWIFYYAGMPRRTHYQVLGVSRDASSIEIANAARDKLADLKSKPVSDEQAEAVREAYQVLTNPDLRYDYDANLPADRAMVAEQKAAERGPGAMETVRDIVGKRDSSRSRLPSWCSSGPHHLGEDAARRREPPPVIEMTRPVVIAAGGPQGRTREARARRGLAGRADSRLRPRPWPGGR